MVKRLGGIWDKVVSRENISRAYENAKKGKSGRKCVAEVELNKE